MKNNKNFIFLFNGWANKEPLRFYLKDSPPVTGVIVAFGKSGFINHFDIITVLRSSIHAKNQEEAIDKEAVEIKIAQIVRIGSPHAAL